MPTYQWQRCDTDGTNSANITGETNPTYTLVPALDSGRAERVSVDGVVSPIWLPSGPVSGSLQYLVDYSTHNLSQWSDYWKEPFSVDVDGFQHGACYYVSDATARNGGYARCYVPPSSTVRGAAWLNVPSPILVKNSIQYFGIRFRVPGASGVTPNWSPYMIIELPGHADPGDPLFASTSTAIGVGLYAPESTNRSIAFDVNSGAITGSTSQYWAPLPTLADARGYTNAQWVAMGAPFYIIPQGSVALNTWYSMVFRVKWASDTSGEIESWAKLSSAGTWASGWHMPTATGFPTVQWLSTLSSESTWQYPKGQLTGIYGGPIPGGYEHHNNGYARGSTFAVVAAAIGEPTTP